MDIDVKFPCARCGSSQVSYDTTDCEDGVVDISLHCRACHFSKVIYRSTFAREKLRKDIVKLRKKIKKFGDDPPEVFVRLMNKKVEKLREL